MRKLIIAGAAVCAALTGAVVAFAGNGTPFDTGSSALTLAVYGDAPYGTSNDDTAELQATPAFVDAINHDPAVGLVVHVGDIHSGSQRCTQAYDQSIFDRWSQYRDPLVYTPGDNEWSDCQKTKELGGDPSLSYGGGDPISNLALVRSIFFPRPGLTLGIRKRFVLSQGLVGRGTDRNYVENVMWVQARTLFVTLNIPGGSNNDDDNWFGAPRTQAQTDEIAQRTQADLHWLDNAFAVARALRDGVRAVVIFEQADMWDLDGKAPSHIAGYKPFVDSIASHTTAFGKPVLLFNGDSHVYRSDDPLVPGAPCVIEPSPGASAVPCSDDAYANQPGGYDVPNFHRVVVHGSTFPLEYTRLTDDPRAHNAASASAFGPFSWTRVQP